RRAPELRNSGRRAVVRLVRANRGDAAFARGRGAVERAVADLELDHVLAGGLQRLGHGEHREGRLHGERARELTELYGHGHTLRNRLEESMRRPAARLVASLLGAEREAAVAEAASIARPRGTGA